MKPIKNPVVQKFCQDVADIYKEDKDRANEAFKCFVYSHKSLKYWEVLAMKEQVLNLIKEK